jgi:hypothetical protein
MCNHFRFSVCLQLLPFVSCSYFFGSPFVSFSSPSVICRVTSSVLHLLVVVTSASSNLFVCSHQRLTLALGSRSVIALLMLNCAEAPLPAIRSRFIGNTDRPRPTEQRHRRPIPRQTMVAGSGERAGASCRFKPACAQRSITAPNPPRPRASPLGAFGF